MAHRNFKSPVPESFEKTLVADAFCSSPQTVERHFEVQALEPDSLDLNPGSAMHCPCPLGKTTKPIGSNDLVSKVRKIITPLLLS